MALAAASTVLLGSLAVTAGSAAASRPDQLLGPAVVSSKDSGTTTLRTGLPVDAAGAHLLRLSLSEPYRSSAGTALFDTRAEGASVSEKPGGGTVVDFPVDVRDGVLDVLLERVPNRVQVQSIQVLTAAGEPVAPAPATTTTSPTVAPTTGPTTEPTTAPTTSPTTTPTTEPTTAPTTEPTTAPAAFAPGTAIPPVGASLTEPACTRRYQIPGLLNSATTGDNLLAFNSAIAAAQSGDCLTVPAGTYRRSGNIDVPATKSGITIIGAGRDQTVLLGTSLDKHGFRILGADRVRLQGMTLDTVGGGTRTGSNQQGHATLLLDPGTDGFVGQDLLLRGARAAGFFAYRASNYHLHRVAVQNSLADAFHNANGSVRGTFTDCVATNPGDDGWAMVGYGGDAATIPHDFTVTRFQMHGNPHGRGFGIINSYGLRVHGPTLISDTSAAGIIIARETQYGGTMHPVRDIRFLGETHLVRANHNREDHGAVLINNPEPSQPVEGVYLENLRVTDTGKNRYALPSRNIYVKGTGRISAELKDFRFYGSGPASLIGGARTADSTVSLIGWSGSDGYSPS